MNLRVPVPIHMLIQAGLDPDGPFEIRVENERLIISNPAADLNGKSLTDALFEALSREGS